jgi:hypothetical protein
MVGFNGQSGRAGKSGKYTNFIAEYLLAGMPVE